jgi:glycosyltransferase involved in cell wall biosynthesis
MAKTKNICIVVSSLGFGGAERSSAILSELLSDLGFEIHIVSVLDKIDYSYKGKLLNLGKLKAKDDSVLGRLKRLKTFKNYLSQHNFDFVIDSRTRIGFLKEFIISKCIYNNTSTIYNVHSHNTDLYINSSKFLGKLLYTSSKNIVTVSKAIGNTLKNKYGFTNIKTIYNTLIIESSKDEIKTKIEDSYIMFYGRLDDEVKNIKLLLEGYAKSKLPERNISLKILGDGKDLELLKQKTKDLKLSDFVKFSPFDPNPLRYVESAYFTILTSRYEGFPMVILESLSVGTPVIAVDCKSGPREIIINEHNGLLIENHNIEALVTAMNRMLDDKELYLHCKANAKQSVQKFSKEAISLQWQALLK